MPPTVTVCVVAAAAVPAAPPPIGVVAVVLQGTVIVSMTSFTDCGEVWIAAGGGGVWIAAGGGGGEVWITAGGGEVWTTAGGGGGEDESMGTPAICCVRVSVWMMWERRVCWGFVSE